MKENINQQMRYLSTIQKLAATVRATVIFYDPCWSEETQREWNQLTKNAPASTKGLADFCRATLTETGFPRWGAEA